MTPKIFQNFMLINGERCSDQLLTISTICTVPPGFHIYVLLLFYRCVELSSVSCEVAFSVCLLPESNKITTGGGVQN